MPESDIAPSSILGRLTTEFIGRNLLYYPTIPSTMERAKKAAKESAPEGTVVIAAEQTAGRGRLGRAWLSPSGSISLSLLLYPDWRHLPRLNMMASLAVAHSLEKVCGLETEIKWPNDVLIRGKKVCGILIESALRGHSVDWAIIGIGINANLDVSSISGVAATSLSGELGHTVPRSEVLQCLLGELERLYQALRRGEPLHQEWQSRLITLGRTVQAKSGDSIQEGYAEAVDEDGALLLRLPDGSLSKIAAGEVTLQP